MSNASCCRRAAAHFAQQAERCADPDEARAFRDLARLWSEMAELAERFDRDRDDAAKARIYAMMEEVEAVRQRVV